MDGSRLEGAHPSLGLSAAGGLAASWAGGLLARASVTAGLFLGRFDVRLEVAPMSEFVYLRSLDASTVLAASVGYFAPLVERRWVVVGWPLRVGAALVIHPGTYGSAYLLPRVTTGLLGVAFRLQRVHLEALAVASFALSSQGQLAEFVIQPLTVSASLLF